MGNDFFLHFRINATLQMCPTTLPFMDASREASSTTQLKKILNMLQTVQVRKRVKGQKFSLIVFGLSGLHQSTLWH